MPDPAVKANEALESKAQQPLTVGALGGNRDLQLRVVFDVARVLATERDPDIMLGKFLADLISAYPAADAGILLLHDPSDGMLAVRAAQGYDLQPLSQMRLGRGEGISGKVFETGRAEVYETQSAVSAAMSNMADTNRSLFQKATVGVDSPLSALCVPLTVHDKKIGVLTLQNLRQAGVFSYADLAFLQLVADLIALAVENARLAEELQGVQAISEANRLKAELISTLAHEMRTPLTSIKGYSSALLMEDAEFSPDTQSEFLKIIDEECDVLQDLIHDLLESSIIDAGLLKLELQPVLIPRIANGILADIAQRHKECRFLVDFPNAFPIVDADPQRIAQVLRNLLDNAVKYSPGGGLIVVRGQAEENEVVISVADQGEGIAPEHLHRLFEKFFRIKSGLGRHVVGTGLGLPIARTIVESHGGRIWADSVVGQGSTFYFTIPLRSRVDEFSEPKES